MTRAPATGPELIERLTAHGTSAGVAEELERRIEIIEQIEADHPSRRPLSPGELTIYVGTTVLAGLAGLLVVIL